MPDVWGEALGEQREFYRRHLPHWQPEGATFHVVFRLAASLPLAVIEEMRIEKDKARRLVGDSKDPEQRSKLLFKLHWDYFTRFDAMLDRTSIGPLWLRQPEIAGLVKEAMHYRDGKVYDLIAYSIMPNHVHMIIELVGRVADPTLLSITQAEALFRQDVTHIKDAPVGLGGRDGVPSYGLTNILASLKKYTALRANRILGRSGPFWQSESYDHVIRDDRELERTIWYVLQNPVQAGLVQSWKQWPWNYCKWNLL